MAEQSGRRLHLKQLLLIWMSVLTTEIVALKNKAILSNAGKFFYNFRMETNVHLMKNILTDGGFDDRDILIFSCDNIPCNPAILSSPSIRNVPGDKTASVLRGPHELEYSTEDNHPSKFLEVLIDRYHKYETNYKKLERDQATNFYLYIIGHGGDKYIKIQDTTVIFAEELKNFLHDPVNALKANNSFYFSDSCSAGTIFYLLNKPAKSIFMGSSSWDQKSTSLDQDEIYSMPLNDKFMFYLNQFYREKMKKRKQPTISEALGYLTRQKLGEADLLNYNTINRTYSEVYFKEFFSQNEKRGIEMLETSGEEAEKELKFIDDLLSI